MPSGHREPFIKLYPSPPIKRLLGQYGGQKNVDIFSGRKSVKKILACGESRHEDIGLGAFDRIVMYTGVDSLQDVVGA